MTTSRTLVLSAVVAAGLSAQAMAQSTPNDGWGASWSFGPVHPTTTNHIIYTKTTMVPGRLPPIASGTGPLFIWPGLSNPTSDLIQTTADAWGDNASACGAATGQWCLEASVFGSFGQRSGPSVAVDPDDHITIEYKLGLDNNTWTQTVTSQKLGKVVSTLTSTSGLMVGGGFGFATEADDNAFTIDTQYYLCTEIHLAAADPSFGATGVGAAGAMYGKTGTGSGRGTAKNLRTPDGGLTWLVDLITLPAMTPQGTQTPAPAYNCGTGGGGVGGTSGSGGAGGVGRAGGTGGVGGSASGGAGGEGGGAGGGVVAGTGGATGASSGNIGGSSSGEGGASGTPSGSGGTPGGAGGAAAGAGGEGDLGSGGAVATNGASGCACSTSRGAGGGAGGSLLLLGLLVAAPARRRRRM
jgi:MYXO-CTERM domain-containing protein